MEKESITDVATLVAKMNREMSRDYSFCNPETNPLLLSAKQGLSSERLSFSLGEYTALPKSIVQYLTVARDRAYGAGMKQIGDELKRNIGEELGSDSDGVDHYSILMSGLGSELALSPQSTFNQSTKVFIKIVDNIIATGSIGEAIGAVYALESSARPELEIVLQLITLLAEQGGIKLDPKGRLLTFFDRHINDWEVGHEANLSLACNDNLTKNHYDEFAKGFRVVIQGMEDWWDALARDGGGRVTQTGPLVM